jgi:hypothetical protein
MKRAAAIASALWLLFPATAMAEPFCLETRNIQEMRAPDAHSVVFRMRDGTRWRSTLAEECPGLVYNGFVIFPTTVDSICENVQLIRVLENHQVCRLGTLEKIAAR